PTRRSTEIFNQVQLTRKIGRNWHGHIHWSAKSLMENRDGIVQRLAGCYTQPAAVPPMTWLKRQKPESPGVGAMVKSGKTSLRWQVDSATQRVAIQARNGRSWRTLRIAPASQGNLEIPRADAIAVTALDRFGNASPPKVLALP
ncbi:MAG: hypothetical protein ACO3RV_01440, partial [Luteolibacter sp.]